MKFRVAIGMGNIGTTLNRQACSCFDLGNVYNLAFGDPYDVETNTATFPYVSIVII
jgi:hypothetical protein